MISPVAAWEARVRAALFCDDVRREVLGKDILIGVYSSDVLVPAFPASFRMAAWFEYVCPRTGHFEMQVKISLGAGGAAVKIEFDALAADGAIAIPIPPCQLATDKEDTIILEISVGQGPFVKIHEITVRQGPVPPGSITFTPPGR